MRETLRFIGRHVADFFRMSALLLLDAAFLILWLWAQQWVKGFAEEFPPENTIDQLQFDAFRIFFAVTTLAFVLGGVVKHLIAVWREIRDLIHEESRP